MTNETLRVLKERRSIRKFRPEQIKPEDLDAILEAGTWAPTGMGAQSPVMVVVQDPETIAYLSRMNAQIMGNPGQRSLLRRPHRGGGPGGRRTAHLAPGRLFGDGQPDECGGLPGGGVLLDQPAMELFDMPEGKELLNKWGLPDTLRGVGHCVLGYADGPAPHPSPGKRATSSAVTGRRSKAAAGISCRRFPCQS